MKKILAVVLLAFVVTYFIPCAAVRDNNVYADNYHVHSESRLECKSHYSDFDCSGNCSECRSDDCLECRAEDCSESCYLSECRIDCRHNSGYGLGLTSLTVSPLSAEILEAEVIRSDTDNSVKIVWIDEDCTGTLNGASYENGTWITTEGSYLFVLKDTEGNSKSYTFSITHYYETVTVAPTCSERGYTRYTCKQCGGSYDADFISAKGHKYIESTIFATCTESGGLLHTCTVCGYNYLSDIDYPSGHNYDSTVIRLATCTQTGELHEVCEYCHDEVTTIVPALGHNYIIVEVIKEGKNTKRKLECTNCGSTYTENLGNQYEKVGSYMELIFNTYRPYMILAFVGTAGVWSAFIGISYIITRKNEEKEKAHRMLVNYIMGMVAIFTILVTCPYLIRGITALVT